MKRLVILFGLLLGLTIPASAQLAFSPGTLAIPVASPVAGVYGGTQTVTLSDSTSTNAFICYTTDNSTPTGTATSCTNGTQYTVGIVVSSTTTIKAAAFQSYYRASGLLTALYTIAGTPTLTTNTIFQGNSSNVTQQSVSIASGNVNGQAIVVFVKWGDLTPGHFSSLQDCPQSSGNCSSSSDTFTQQITCTAGNSLTASTACAFVVCSSSMASGAWTFTLNLTTAAPFLTLAVSTWANVPTSACVDQTGIATPGSGSANPSVTTSGNIGASNEVGIGMLVATVASPTAACSFTAIGSTGGIQHQSISNPSSGSALTSCWTLSSSNWIAQVLTLK